MTAIRPAAAWLLAATCIGVAAFAVVAISTGRVGWLVGGGLSVMIGIPLAAWADRRRAPRVPAMRTYQEQQTPPVNGICLTAAALDRLHRARAQQRPGMAVYPPKAGER